jgi:UDP-glucose 4-epimerase
LQPHVLIWGGTGFIGGALLEALLESGTSVTVLSRKDAYGMGRRYPQVRILETGFSLDSDAKAVLRESVRDVRLAFNVSGSSGAVSSNQYPLASLRENCAWQLEFLDACSTADHRLHIVFASTRLVYGKPRSLPVGEMHPLSPESVYAAHKLCTEHYHQIYALQGAITYTICRISNPYGVDERGSGKNHGILNQMIQTALLHRPLTIFGDGKQIRDYIHIRDLVRALLLCGEQQAAVNEVFNIGSGEGVSLVDAALQIGDIADAPVVFSQWPESYKLVETGDFVNSIEKARRLLGFVPEFNFEHGIKEAILGGRDTPDRKKDSKNRHDVFESKSVDRPSRAEMKAPPV